MRTRVGHITHYYNQIGVAAVYLIDDIKLGDTLLIEGHTTDLIQPVFSIEIDHNKVTAARHGMEVALEVMEPVREGDEVYRLLVEQDAPENQDIWRLAQEAASQIGRVYEPVFMRFMEEYGVDITGVGILLAAWTFDPQSTTAGRLRVGTPYTSVQGYRKQLSQSAEIGLLFETSPGHFQLTDSGQNATASLIENCRKLIAEADPLPKNDSQRLVTLFGRLLSCCTGKRPPPATWSIDHSSCLMPGIDPPLPYVEQAISSLAAYRDDAHLAAWRLSGLSANAMESLTLIWREEADSLDQIVQTLENRGNTEADFAAALVELRERGFLEGPDTVLRLTGEGAAFREAVESDTDHYFFAPWSCLSAADKVDMGCRLTQLRDALAAV